MRFLLLCVSCILVAACSVGDNGGGSANTVCSDKSQKQYVRDATYEWYLWNDRLPPRKDVHVADFASADELLAYLTTFSPTDSLGNPIDIYSSIGSAEADQQFYGAGRYQGFGFSWRFEGPDDARLTRVFAGSPAAAAQFARGQRIVAVNGRTVAEIEAAEGLDAVLSNSSLQFTMLETDGVTEFTANVDQAIVTIDPVPQSRLIARPAGPDVGYLELAAFINTANAELDQAFADFRLNGVTDLIIDLRYNGGGLISTAELLGDLLGGSVAEGLLYSETRFNQDQAAANNRAKFFQLLNSSISLSRLVVIATPDTASASEMLTNSMDSHVEVVIVGDHTYGKPVGQVGFEFCGKILRPIAFQTFNADGFGDYFGGLPADCVAADDLSIAVGDAADPNMIAALGYLDTGACPAAPVAGLQAKPAGSGDLVRPARHGPPWREIAGAY